MRMEDIFSSSVKNLQASHRISQHPYLWLAALSPSTSQSKRQRKPKHRSLGFLGSSRPLKLKLQTMDGLDDVFRLLENAKSLEKDGQRIEASTKYYEGCHLMRKIVAETQLGDIDPVVVLLKEKIQLYRLQAQRLYFDEESVISPTRPKRPTTPATIILSARTSDDISLLTLPGNQSFVFTDMHKKTGIGNAWLERAINLEEEMSNKTQYSNVST